MPPPSASYQGLEPSSARASSAARGSSKKSDTTCELLLRRALWRAGCRYRKNVSALPGRPDVAFLGARVAVFCDGDFWHGKDWTERRAKLASGSNAGYWLAKIERNMERDRRITVQLEGRGWKVARVWETDVRADPAAIARKIVALVDRRKSRRQSTQRIRRQPA